MQDNTSLGLCGGTITLCAIHSITSSDVLTGVTILAGLSTVVYNWVKIKKELKK